MIEITCHPALGSPAVFRRALNIASRGSVPAISFATGPDGTRVSPRSVDTAAREASITHRRPRNRLKGIKADEIDLEATLAGGTK